MTVFNWYATLNVELEVAGQRGARRDAAHSAREAAAAELDVIERTELARAWRAYFDVLAAREAKRVLERLESVAQRMARAAQLGAEKGLTTGVDADLAEASVFGVIHRKLDAQRDEQLALATLASLLGKEPAQLDVRGTLQPLTSSAQGPPTKEPPEAVALEAQSRAYSYQASALRRDRFPNPTLSAFAQNDGFNEHVLGFGVTFPLPLPEPVGNFHDGAIAENEALSERASELAADSRRTVSAAERQAAARLDAARAAVELYAEARLQRASRTLESLATEIEAGRLGPREAAVIQQPLLDFILGAVEARRALCEASVDVLKWRGALGPRGDAR